MTRRRRTSRDTGGGGGAMMAGHNKRQGKGSKENLNGTHAAEEMVVKSESAENGEEVIDKGSIRSYITRLASPNLKALRTPGRSNKKSRPKPQLKGSRRSGQTSAVTASPTTSHKTDLSNWSTLSPFLTKKCASPGSVKKQRQRRPSTSSTSSSSKKSTPSSVASASSRLSSTRKRRHSREHVNAASPLSSHHGSPTKRGYETHHEVFMPTEEEQDLFLEAQQRALEVNMKQADKTTGAGNSQPGVVDSQLESVVIGRHDIPVWFVSAYPQEYQKQKRIYVCQFCLQYFKTQEQLARHMGQSTACHPRHPPGDEVYRRGKLSLWEIDGGKKKVYCQNLCLLSKLFLESKTLWRDVQPFLFYVLTEWDDTGATIVGYFSKRESHCLNMDQPGQCMVTGS
ncbi:hypothetical protein PTSG_10709 [Salpingoeca rosetta]|uniref:Histone acetyltransferase n=1 Tax=Salpingoeca rosetta (strain ATCC 50818 / BSB-021) TaxID=946362 RepID=F2UQ57_SALR5|nr:uncharacterized protein PTSG_10709 [Salpingoeca rosetta]EGD79725.1 hypothetical protein PTSG_10709 [Salpingoeca rosetta]|eukprot:XP_004988674.1 hypothetical protein PTSG_10709 [Salpingoeca rosetta]